MGFRYDLWKLGINLIIILQIPKFYQRHKRQNEWNCCLEISKARHTLQGSVFGPRLGEGCRPLLKNKSDQTNRSEQIVSPQFALLFLLVNTLVSKQNRLSFYRYAVMG